MKRLTMRKIREALRLHASGFSTRKIAASLGVGQKAHADATGGRGGGLRLTGSGVRAAA